VPAYCIDTSSLVAAWIERYPIQNFPGLWARLDEIISAREIVASAEVLREVKRRDDSLYKWCKERPGLFVEVDDACQDYVIAIMAKYPRFVDTRTGKNSGDPFVIGLAQTYEPRLTVVTEENGGSASRPAIPFVCAAEGIPHTKLLALIQRYGWRFAH
jgi:hypothetical protein